MRQIVNATRISGWFRSASRDAQEILPQLIRKLIAATVGISNLKILGIAAGDGCAGVATTDRCMLLVRTRSFPKGRLGWEWQLAIRSRNSLTTMRTRTTAPLGVDQSVTTFVFVTPHSWEGKAKVESNGQTNISGEA